MSPFETIVVVVAAVLAWLAVSRMWASTSGGRAERRIEREEAVAAKHWESLPEERKQQYLQKGKELADEILKRR